MAALATAFIRVRPDTSGFRRETEREADASGRAAGRRFGESAGREASRAMAKGFGDGGVFARVLATTAAKVTLLGSAAGAAAPGVLKLAGALAPAAGAAVALPAALLGIVAATNTLKLAVAGVGKAIEAGFGDDAEKAAEALAKLPPAARAFAREVIGLKGQLTGLRTAVSNSFFGQFAGETRLLAQTYLPLLQRRLPQIAVALGGFADNFVRAARTGTLFQGVNAVLGGTARGLALANNAVRPLTDALGTLLSTGASLLPKMGAGVATLAARFNAFIQSAARTGQLSQWLRDAIVVLKDLAAIAGNVFGILRSLINAANAGGNTLLATLRQVTGEINRFFASATGSAALRDVFAVLAQLGQALRTALAAVLPAVAQGLKTLGPTFGQLAQTAAQFVVALAPLIPAFSQVANIALRLLIPALGALARFLTEHETAMYVAATAAGAYALASKAVGVALTIQAAGGMVAWLKGLKVVTVATKVAAAAQWLFNAAIAFVTSPIGIVVLAVAALTAAIIYAYKHSSRFREIVQATWRGIQVAAQFAWERVIRPALQGMARFFTNVVGPAAVWLWRRVLVPAFTGIAAVVNFAWNNVIMPALRLAVWWFRNVTAPTVMFLWKRVFLPAWNGISAVVQFAWTKVIQPVLAALAWYGRHVVAPVLTWLWRNIAQPVFRGLALEAKVAWALIKVVFGLIVIWIKAFVVPTLKFLWLTAKVAWAGITAVSRVGWAGLKLIFGALVTYIKTFVVPGLRFLWSMTKIIWGGITSTISLFWNKGIKPVFSALGGFISKHVVPAFQAGVSAIGRAWDRIRALAMAPVRFVIDTVINNGIIKAYNTLAGVFGAPKVRPIVWGPTTAQRASRSGVQQFADGGHVRGPGGPRSDKVQALLSNGEYVIPTRVVREHGVKFFDQLAGKGSGRPGRGTHMYADGGLVGFAKDAWGMASNPARLVKRPIDALINRIPGAGTVVNMVAGMGRKLVGGLLDWIRKHSFGAGGGAGNWPSGPGAQRGDSGVWRRILALIKSTGPVSGSFGNAYRHGDPLWHGCVPMDTRILTRRGWLTYDEVVLGEDETIGYNPATGKNEWTLIVGLHHYADAEVWTMQNTWFRAEVTPGHRWLVDQQVTVQTETVCTECGREFATGRGMTKHRADVHGVLTPRRERFEEQLVATRDFKQSTRIHLSKPANLASELPLTDDEAELIGWIFADGHMEPFGPTIVQSKPEQVRYLRGFMGKFPCGEYVRQPEARQNHVIYRWKLPFDYWADLASRSKASKTDALGFVLNLSVTQRAAFVRGFLAADGTRDPRTQDERLGYAAFQVSGPVAEAIKVAAYLEGYRPDTNVRTEFGPDRFGTQPMEHIGFRTPIVKSRHMKRVAVRQADVWCPTTTLGTWTARQGEEIFLTGNSGRAVDWMGYNQDALASFLAARRPLELIHRTNTRDYAFTRGRDMGSFNASLMEAHRNHIHVAMRDGGLVGGSRMLLGKVPVFDLGGILRPGLNVVDNRTGGYEHLVPAGRRAGGITLNIYGPVGSQRELDNWLVKAQARLRNERRIQ